MLRYSVCHQELDVGDESLRTSLWEMYILYTVQQVLLLLLKKIFHIVYYCKLIFENN